MVFGRFRGRPSKSSTPPTSSQEEAMVVVEKAKLHEEEDGWAEVLDVKEQPPTSAGTGATTDEEGPEVEEAWDWALEGDSSTDGSVNQWVLDDFLVSGEDAQPKPEVPREELQSAKAEQVPSSEAAPANSEAEGSLVRESSEGSEAKCWPAQCQGDVGSSAAAAPAPAPEEDGGFRCRCCNTFVFRGADILSSNYQAMTGPGYLIASTRNTVAATETQTVTYTTGNYIIREVFCEFCNDKLGVTYVLAPDTRNEYKVGKFLIGADRLILPPGVVHPKARS